MSNTNNELIVVTSAIMQLKAAAKYKNFNHDTFQSVMSFANNSGLYIALVKKKERKVVSDINISACSQLVKKLLEMIYNDEFPLEELRDVCKTSSILSDVALYGQDDPSAAFMLLVIFQNSLSSTLTPASYLIDLITPYLHKAYTTSLEPKWAEQHPLDALTAREKEVYDWLSAGKTNREIGLILGISPFTVKNHVASILDKLNAPNRSAALALCN